MSQDHLTSRPDHEVAPQLCEISLLWSPHVAVYELPEAVTDRSQREDVARARPSEIERVV